MAIDKTTLAWTVVLSVEMLAVFSGNAIAIAVFWRQRLTQKRTCYLLIHLSVADFLVGIGEIENLVKNVWYLLYSKPVFWGNFAVLDVFSGLASLAFLAVISMERLYAIAWPYRHRATAMRVYTSVAVVAWSLPTVITIIYLCGFAFEIISTKTATLTGAFFVVLCLVVITCSYLAIWFSKRNEDPRIPIDRREQNKKLAKTLFIVSFLSVLSWMPLTVSYIISFVLSNRLDKSLHYTGRCLQLANSFINPIVYYARMPDFARILKNIFRRTQISPLEIQVQPFRWMPTDAERDRTSTQEARTDHEVDAQAEKESDVC